MTGFLQKIREAVTDKDSLVHSDKPSLLEQERELGTAGHEGTGPRDPTTGHLEGEANPMKSLVGMDTHPRDSDNVEIEPQMALTDSRDGRLTTADYGRAENTTAGHTGPEVHHEKSHHHPHLHHHKEAAPAAHVPLHAMEKPIAAEPVVAAAPVEPVVQTTAYSVPVQAQPILGSAIHDGPLPRDSEGHLLETGTRHTVMTQNTFPTAANTVAVGTTGVSAYNPDPVIPDQTTRQL